MPELTELATRLAEINDPEIMERFFDEILTPAEKKALSLRWRLMKLLKDGVPQRKIASDLGISLCKITRGSKIIKDSESITNKILNRNI